MSQAQIDGGMRDEMAGNQGSNRLLYSAIENRLLFGFRYKGNERIVEPHDYGIQKGIERLLCWQIGGQSGGPIPGWRLVDVAGIQDCEVLNQEFSGGREVPGKHHRWDNVFIRVAPAKQPDTRRTG
ncbi:MAG: hypothetical protein WBV36_18810 [Terriglobales bacterium]